MNWKLVLVGTIVILLLWAGGWWAKEPPHLELSILHTNDVHGHYAASDSGGASRLATAIAKARATTQHSLLLDAGDQFQGSLIFTVGGPEVVAAVMNALGYDAMAVGNHEFDLGPAALARFISEVNFPVLSANIDATADPELDGDIEPFEVFLFEGDVVGVFGLTTETTVTASSPGDDIVFEAVARRARSVVEMLERQGVDKIIALTHLGYAQDLELAASVEGIDVIVGGHSHTTLGAPAVDAAYPTWVTSTSGDPVVVVTDGEWGQALGRLDVIFDSGGRIVSATGAPIPMSGDVPEAPAMVSLLSPYADQAQALLGEAVGATATDLDGDRSRVRAEETNLGDAIADAILWKTAGLGADVALMNGGGIRSSIPQGPITMGQVLEVLPYGNEITILTLTGAELTAALENSVSQVEGGAGRFLQVGGLRFSFDPAAAAGSRIRSVDLWHTTTQTYSALVPRENVVVATNDYLAGGGDGYTVFSDASSRYDTGWLVSDAFAEYARDASPLRAQNEGRIRRTGAP